MRLAAAGKAIPAEPVRQIAGGNHLAAQNDEAEPGEFAPSFSEFVPIEERELLDLDEMRRAGAL